MTDQAQDAKKMEKLNNIFFTLMARGPDGMHSMPSVSLPKLSNWDAYSVSLSLYLVLHIVSYYRITRYIDPNT